MKILKLQVQGFRSLRNLEWSPGDLNIVIGPNGSGKSNLLKALELIAVSARGGLGPHIQREGGMDPLLWDGQMDSLKFAIKTSPFDSNRDVERESLDYSLELGRLGKSSSYRITEEILANWYRVRIGEREQPLRFLERSPQHSVIFDEAENGLHAPSESVPEEESLLSLASGPFTSNRVIFAFHGNLSKWQIYQEFQTHQNSPVRQPAVTRSDTLVEPNGQNLLSVLHTLYTGSREFKQDLNKAMQAAFGDDFEELVFPPAADQRIQLRIRWKSLHREQSTSVLSDGTLRFMFLLAILANPSPPPLVAIDEPETGLHPSMLPVIADYAIDASLRTQLFLTTHSAEFLDAFGDRIPTVGVTEWKDGETHLKLLSGESLSYWLNQYTLGELYRTGELEALE